MTPEERIKRLNTLKQLLDDGVLTKEEVEQEKIKILQSIESPSHNSSFNHKEDSFTAQVPVEHKGAKQRVYWICGICGAALFLLLFSFLILKQKDAKTNRESRVDSASIESPVSDSHSGIINGHEWIDLGLPSGVKWATCNIGAASYEKEGDRFAWSETASRTEFDHDNDSRHYLKYGSDCDQNKVLENIDDAATMNWGEPWRTPTIQEFIELKTQCDWKWLKEEDGGPGYRVISKKNGNSIFLPYANFIDSFQDPDPGSNSSYWTANLGYRFSFLEPGEIWSWDPDGIEESHLIATIKEGETQIDEFAPTQGCVVRPVTK